MECSHVVVNTKNVKKIFIGKYCTISEIINYDMRFVQWQARIQNLNLNACETSVLRSFSTLENTNRMHVCINSQEHEIHAIKVMYLYASDKGQSAESYEHKYV